MPLSRRACLDQGLSELSDFIEVDGGGLLQQPGLSVIVERIDKLEHIPLAAFLVELLGFIHG